MKRVIFRAAKSFIYFLLNLLIVLICTVVPFYYSVIALTEPQTVTTVIQNIDYKTLIKKTPALEATLKDYGIDYKKADEIIKSKEAGELIEVYVDEATEIFLSVPDNRKFDTSLVKQLVDDNIDKVLTVAKENTNIEFNEKEVKETVSKYIEENESEIKEYVPIFEQVHTVIKQIKFSKIVSRTLTLPFIIILTSVMLIITALIFIIKRRNFKGLIFLGVDFSVASIILDLTVCFCESSFVTSLALQMSDFGVSIIESAVSVYVDRIIIAIISTTTLAVVSFVLFAVLCRFKSIPPKASDTANMENTGVDSLST